ncbi:hypothetical protein S7711_05526 [Stachybotrys chartarum IBT 7711]|uniref:DNA-directed RNA polymerase III complex subunit Rpc37 n=1 Tax=Stachybotrys chartarum (strain CBS 109288 / IBT 7711) TaxID=1280523 RepID=A0A084AS38_STACB|nr:hypothetical protein S7711_05526 [Stachybotrys chartarum IBT 7711]
MAEPERKDGMMVVDDSDGTLTDEDDPITATYNVYLNPSPPAGRRILVLQQPNRTDQAPHASPTELRLKPRSSMVEVDMGIDHSVAYDREKGLRWGRILQSSMASKNGGSHGLAGGFGFGAVQQRGGARKRADEDEDEHMDWNEAMRQQKVLTTQTLGGQLSGDDGVQYMVGVFQGMDLHLTPVSSLVHLRPQLHHIDAAAQLERQGAGGGAGKDAAPSSASAGPRAIHMTIKTTADGDSVTTETIADRLRSIQGEPWRKMRYVDENDEAAWDAYNDSLFLKPTQAEGDTAPPAAGADEKPPVLEDAVPVLRTPWGETEYLESIFGKKPVPPPKPVPAPAKVKEEPKVKEAPVPPKPEAEEAPRPRATRTRGGSSAAGAARRGARGKTGGA